MKTGMGVAALVALAAMAVAAERPVRKPLGFADIGVYGTLFDFCDFSVYKLRYSAKTPEPERLARYRKLLHETAASGKRNLVGLYTFDRVKHSRPISEYIANTDAVLDAIDLADVYAVFLSEENVTWANGLNVLNALYDHIKKRHPTLPVYQWLTAPMAPHPKLKADGWCYDLYGPDPVTCHAAPPERREVTLKPDKTGKVAYRDDFASTKYLHLAHITNPPELEWRRGHLGTHGVKGRANVVVLRWKCVSERPLADIRVRLACSAHEKALGASNALAVSLDGKQKLAEETTRDKPKNRVGQFRGALELDLSKDKRLQGVREFWVHAEMRNGCGVKTGTSNVLDALQIGGSVRTSE